MLSRTTAWPVSGGTPSESISSFTRSVKATDISRRPAWYLSHDQVIDPFLPPAADNVVAFVKLFEKVRYLFGQMLKVTVHRDDNLASCIVETGGKGGRLSVVAP